LSSNAFPDVVILSGARTPMAEWVGGKRGDGQNGGALAPVTALDLGASAARAALDRADVAPGYIDHVVMGNALQTSGDAIYGARHVGLKAGVSDECPALTVNRLCGSGLQAVVTASEWILTGQAKHVLAGGMESMSQSPFVVRNARQGLRLGHAQFTDLLMESLMDPMCGFYMAQTAMNLAKKYDISRAEQDAYALRSQQAATKAFDAGYFTEEIVPVEIKSRKGVEMFAADDHRRADASIEGLTKLPAAFSKDGSVTAGNASGIVDGGAALIVSAEAGGQSVGKVLGWCVAGVDPSIMGIGPVPAITGLLEITGRKLADIKRIEINEAFAAQYLACERELKLNRDLVNVNGGAIALGHPLGATGVRIIYTLARELKRAGGGLGIASACIGGGQGIAVMVEV